MRPPLFMGLGAAPLRRTRAPRAPNEVRDTEQGAAQSRQAGPGAQLSHVGRPGAATLGAGASSEPCCPLPCSVGHGDKLGLGVRQTWVLIELCTTCCIFNFLASVPLAEGGSSHIHLCAALR